MLAARVGLGARHKLSERSERACVGLSPPDDIVSLFGDSRVDVLLRSMGTVYKANGVQTNDSIALCNFYLHTIPHPVPPDSLFLMATAEDPESDQGRFLWRYLSFDLIAAWPPQLKRRGSLRAEAPGIVFVQYPNRLYPS